MSLAIAGALAGTAHAQQATDTDGAKTLDNVIVTGTRKVGMAVDDSPAPVQVVTAEAIQESGAPDLMNQLAFQVPSFNASQQGTDMTSATLVANMRALSPNHTLVLVNGKRRHTTSNVAVLGNYAGAAPVDLSFIPTSAIASTEVLTDGAAALYGSDAIAGVINIITKKNSSGGSVRANVGGYDDGGGFSTNYQGEFGFGNDRGYFNVAVESERRETINRPGSPYGAAACVADNIAGTGCAANGATTANGYIINTGANLARASEYNMIFHPWFPYNQHQGDSPDIDRDIAFLSGGVFLGETTELYATGSFGKKDTVSTQSYRRPSQDGGYDANGDGDRTDPIGGTNPYTGQPLTEADLNMYPLGFNPNIESEEKDWEIGVGITGQLAGWTYDLSSNYGKNDMDVYTTNSMNFILWQQYGFSPTDFYDGGFSASQWTSGLDLSREFDWGLAQPVTLAAGVEYRRETYEILAGEEASYYGSGGQSFPGYNPAFLTGEQTRNNKAVYANLILSPTERLLLDVAARYEKYSDFGSKAVGKLTARYDFTDRFALRGTVSTGFRAPTMGENYYTATQVGPTAATATVAPTSEVAKALGLSGGLKPETSRNISLGLVFRPLDNLTTTLDAYQIRIDDRVRMGTFAYSTGQSSNTWTAVNGGTTNPNLPDPGDTNKDGTPDSEYNAALAEALILGGYITEPFVAGQVPSAGGSLDQNQLANISVGFFNNLLDTKTTGVDWVTSYNTEFDWGGIDWTLAANYNETEVTGTATASQALDNAVMFSAEDIWNIEKNSPKYRVNLGASIHFGEKFSLNIRENLYGPQSTIASATAYTAYPQVFDALDIVEIDGTPYYKAEIGSLLTTNVEFVYQPVEGLRVSVGADNLTNEYPDKLPQAIIDYNNERYATTSARDYLLGSPLGFFGTRWYAKVAYEW